MLSWLIGSVALAGSVYVNGVNVDGLKNQTFRGAEVTIDAKGNIHITAPGYNIQVTGGSRSRVPPPPAVPMTSSVPAGPVTAGTVAGGLVAPGRWWLATDDAGTLGHAVTVYVNGTRVHASASGEGNALRDIGPFMRPGNNTVRVESTTDSRSSGSLMVLVSTGENRVGTVVLDTPRVRYGTGAAGAMSREYTIVAQ